MKAGHGVPCPAARSSPVARPSSSVPQFIFIVGSWDYGDRLSVSWYVVLNVPGAVLGVDYIKVDGKFQTRGGLHLAPRMWWRKRKSKKGGWVLPENMNMLDEEELENFMSLVRSIVEDELKNMMKSLDLDFSKVDMKSRGFVNIA